MNGTRLLSAHRLTACLCATLVSGATFLLLYGLASSQTDPRSLGARDLPARVKAIVGLPPTMDAQNCVTWGRWEVCFGSNPPVANYVQYPEPGPFHFIDIGPLRCKNPVIGDIECRMRLQVVTLPDMPVQGMCSITGLLNQADMYFRCPSGLVLE